MAAGSSMNRERIVVAEAFDRGTTRPQHASDLTAGEKIVQCHGRGIDFASTRGGKSERRANRSLHANDRITGRKLALTDATEHEPSTACPATLTTMRTSDASDFHCAGQLDEPLTDGT